MTEFNLISPVIKEDFNGQNEWRYTPAGQDWTWGALIGDWPPIKAAIEKHTPRQHTIITGGAHVGLYAHGYAGMFKRVYAFEPHPLHFYCLVGNVQLNHVIKIQAGLGEEASFGAMVGDSVGASMSVAGEDVFLPIIPIDVFHFTDVDVIQLDVEGYELRALKGAIRTITKFKPLLILENGHHQEIVDFLIPLGYTTQERLTWDTVWKYTKDDATTPQVQ